MVCVFTLHRPSPSLVRGTLTILMCQNVVFHDEYAIYRKSRFAKNLFKKKNYKIRPEIILGMPYLISRNSVDSETLKIDTLEYKNCGNGVTGVDFCCHFLKDD